jgi:hypothetical protein
MKKEEIKALVEEIRRLRFKVEFRESALNTISVVATKTNYNIYLGFFKEPLEEQFSLIEAELNYSIKKTEMAFSEYVVLNFKKPNLTLSIFKEENKLYADLSASLPTPAIIIQGIRKFAKEPFGYAVDLISSLVK